MSEEIKEVFDDIEIEEAKVDGLIALAKKDSKNKELRALLKASQTRVGQQAQIISAYESLAKIKKSSIKIAKGSARKKSQHTAVALASDWHTPQIVDPDEVGGLNKHNLDIGRERASKFFVDLARLVKDEQGRFTINNLVLWLGGDFMVNELHGIESARCCDLTPLGEVRVIKEVLVAGIDHLLRELDCNLKIPTSFGNHGRTTERTRFQNAADYSYEHAMYVDLATHYKNEKRIEFDVRPMFYKTMDVGGFNIMFTHGDVGFRYWGGVGGLSVPLLRQIPRWKIDYDFDLVCLGHFHKRIHLREAQLNGCLVGYDTYAAGKGFGHERPSQTFFLVDHERKDVGTIRPIWVD